MWRAKVLWSASPMALALAETFGPWPLRFSLWACVCGGVFMLILRYEQAAAVGVAALLALMSYRLVVYALSEHETGAEAARLRYLRRIR